jgi:hypothetical protein
MKNYIIGIALALVLILGIAALAEGTDTVPENPAVAAPSNPAVTEEAEATPDQVTDDNAALQDALDAYRSAKQDKAVSDLEAELKEYVEAGSLTQEQADLILSNVKERLAAKNGECPNCGYKFENKGRGMGGNRQRGGCSQMPQMNGQQFPQMGGQQNGQQFPQMNGQMPDYNR